jgi:F420-dependent oxidoreductase-like protein
MRVGLQIPSFTWPGGADEIGSRLADIARTADDAGFASLWVMDHFFQIPMVGPAEQEMLEGYGALSFMAAVTKRVSLGTMVTGVTYRLPGILIKAATTLDVLSGGRAYLGIGAAWFDREHAGLGVPFPPLGERFRRLEETLRIAKRMWSDEVGPFEGEYYRLAETLNVPQPVSRPHPPILIGGLGEKKTLRLVAQYGDACNLFGFVGLEVLRHKLDVLKRHCDDVGRSYDEIERTTLDTADLTPGKHTTRDIIEKCRAYAELGFQHAIFNVPAVEQLAPLEAFGKEVIPEVAGF